ncbi:MAG: hypothetical protein PPHEMADMSA_2930 [uncultured Paraburkholderia sp.]|nr:MAG: hypothetical protein PPHEMADMSA_2930 [uncultured Paraburkholderia sp.]CAH2926442.1 MAG: hypothetical protein PPHERAN_2956 [uncultured Paraburkholderia sp.]
MTAEMPRARERARADAGAQAKRAVVRQMQRVLLIVGAQHDRERPEDQEETSTNIHTRLVRRNNFLGENPISWKFVSA